ncbi:FkbM family methyltransferase [Legionella waltersii]|uniref:Methoxymalonyl CoA synthase n=1 Tax=Legionella waltersii TaxID=66969 RepID=A0A0W1ADM4_9GAMM|nr:FkbM family methyltransferase [Legionella waltersii]KTD79235.1 methoxymalonyl CoA synthase [Legionella waltersii]SNV12658.1 methoxymalonyl CoA synthase [Legionella waltersii]
MPKEPSKKDTKMGQIYYVNESDLDFLLYEIIESNAYFLDFLELKPGDVVFDVGANIGVFSLLAVQHCQRDLQLYSFEPIPSNFECLQRNLEAYKSMTHLYNLALGDPPEDCDIEFTQFGNSSLTASYRPKDKLISNFQPFLQYERLAQLSEINNKPLFYLLKYLPFLRSYIIKRHFKKITAETKLTCRLSSLGRVINQHSLDRIDYLKIDVEGAEVDVLKGIKPEQFSTIKQLCIEVHDINHRVEKVDAFLKHHGYVTRIHRNPIFAQFGLNHHMIYAKRTL